MNFEKLREIRIDNDMTQKEVACILNVSRSTYSGWENGIDNIPLTKLNEFCNYFNVSIDYVCGLSNTKSYNGNKNNIDKMIVSKNLRRIRIKNNDTQEYIAQIINTDQSNYSKYELGKTLILTSFIIDFAKHYNVSIDFICGKTKELNIKIKI